MCYLAMTMQYFTNLHAAHALRSPLLSSPLPQLAQLLVVSLTIDAHDVVLIVSSIMLSGAYLLSMHFVFVVWSVGVTGYRI